MTWRTKYLLTSCVGKKPYTLKAATKKINRKKAEGINLRWYSCENCQRIHITKQGVEQPKPTPVPNVPKSVPIKTLVPLVPTGRLVVPELTVRPRYTAEIAVTYDPAPCKKRQKD